MTGHRVSVEIAAPPAVLYDLIADAPAMAKWSPEVTRCDWIGTATGPELGARFRGWSRRGWRRWSTTSTVVTADRPTELAWQVTFLRLPVATWRYTFTPADGGTTVTEAVEDERGRILQRLSPYITGSPDRQERNDETMRATLDTLKATVETSSTGR